MTTIIKSGFAAFMLLLAFSCKKENIMIQTSSNADESTTQAILTDMNEPAAKEVTIGTQVWMKRNWTGTRYRNGDRIPQVTDANEWRKLTTGAWCWYNNDSANGHIYGKLYNWYAVNDPRGLAPEGWHVPSDAEWTTLTTYLGGESVAGGKMKSTGTIEAGTGLWYAPNRHATNSSGFTALPGGYRYSDDGTFSYVGIGSSWLSSTESHIPNYAWYRTLYYFGGDIERSTHHRVTGCYVRLLRD